MYRQDVERFEMVGVTGILVGEALMRAADPTYLIDVLVGRRKEKKYTRVEICGVQSVEAALYAAKSGADFIGIIMVSKSKRQVSVEVALEISNALRSFREGGAISMLKNPNDVDISAGPQNWFNSCAKVLSGIEKKPLLVGVFQNQSFEYIEETTKASGLDLIQLHGDEEWDICPKFSLPVIKCIHVGEDSGSAIIDRLQAGKSLGILLDTQVKGAVEKGGHGISFDWKIAGKVSESGIPLILAGGLTPINVQDAIREGYPWAVDVSSGVETDGNIIYIYILI